MTPSEVFTAPEGFPTGRGARKPPAGWVGVCRASELLPDRGVAALVDGRAIAVFRLSSGELHAVDNLDPCSGASVLSRGLIGDADGVPTVASPMYKQRFDLRTGRCLDAEVEPLHVHGVCVVDGVVHVASERGEVPPSIWAGSVSPVGTDPAQIAGWYESRPDVGGP
jgi:nitrite reductase (NADH) small subunit